MPGKTNNDSLLEMFIFETGQLIDELEQLVIRGEKGRGLAESIHEIFRVMHTIKGSSAMMQLNDIAELSHAVEDLFFYLREKSPENADYDSIGDIVLDTVDFIKGELLKIESGNPADGQSLDQIARIKTFLKTLKDGNEVQPSDGMNGGRLGETRLPSLSASAGRIEAGSAVGGIQYQATIFFADEAEMVDIRAFGVVHALTEMAEVLNHRPENLSEEDPEIERQIRQNGLKVEFRSNAGEATIRAIFEKTPFVKGFQFSEIPGRVNLSAGKPTIVLDENERPAPETGKMPENVNAVAPQNQAIISVKLVKTDRLMDLMGELVIAEALVTQNPDLKGLKLANFQKAARLLRKITHEMQDAVMSIRMVPLTATFQKMHRIVRDMGKKIGKDVVLKISGEETEVDKNIIDHISDPLMHLVRNAIDHGIETAEDRLAQGKPKDGTLFLEAKNAGKDVLVILKDDGKGLNKQKILKKAQEKGLLVKPESEMTDKEIYNLIFLPGFSTKDNVTEFSGRGVGMDVVVKNIEKVGGMVSVDSLPGSGTTVTLKIPLTLAIIDGMNIKVGAARYTIPTISIKESFRPKDKDIIRDPDGNEMIMVRGECLPIIRLHEHFKIKTDVIDFTQGILIMAEHNEKSFCLFADKLLGEQQVVVKALPEYLRKIRKIHGLAGCTLLGDGSVSLILDVGGLTAVGRPA